MKATLGTTVAASLIFAMSACHSEAKTDNDLLTLGCEANDGSRTFSLTFNKATNQATLSGEISVPSLSHGYTIAPVVHVTEDPIYQDFFLTITPPPSGNFGGTMVTTLPISETFDVSSKSYVKVYLDGPNVNSFQSLICPVPTRAMPLD